VLPTTDFHDKLEGSIPSLIGTKGAIKEERARLQQLVQDLEHRQDALRQELDEEVKKSHGREIDAARSAQILSKALQSRSIDDLSTAGIAKLKRDVTRMEEHIGCLQQEIHDKHIRRDTEWAEVAVRVEELTQCRTAAQDLQERVRDVDTRTTGALQPARMDSINTDDRPRYTEHITWLRRELADAYTQLAAVDDASIEEEIVSLRRQYKQARLEHVDMLSPKPLSSLGKSQLFPLQQVSSDRRSTDASIELIGRVAQQRREIASLKEELRREELRVGSHRSKEDGVRSTGVQIRG